jgi:hypothetical protein
LANASLRLQAVACRATGAVYRFAPNWKEEHGLSHLADARGILQAPSHGLQAKHCRVMDGYKGCAKLYEPDPDSTPALTSKAILKWANDDKVEWHYIDLGKPQQNGYIESFNGSLRPYRR